MYYKIAERLCTVDEKELFIEDYPYVAVLSSKEWQEHKDKFDMVIDIEFEEIRSTKAEVNYDSLTGSFNIPDRKQIEKTYKFHFALDEKAIVFIDDSGIAEDMILGIQTSKKWKIPSLERFIYDFLEKIIHNDLALLEQYDLSISKMEDDILSGKDKDTLSKLNVIKGELLDLSIHYGQLLDLGQELEENENGFFKEDNLRYFRLFSSRVSRLKDILNSLREYSIQLMDLYQSQLDVKQNKIMSLLTVVTAVFAPLTLIVGWYGMNFKYMPELASPYGYPLVIVVSLLIVVASLVYFKFKKWL